MPQRSFSAQVSAWVAETKERVVAVRNEAAQRTVELMQTPVAAGGNLPVDTGFMRASLRALIGIALPGETYRPDGPGHYGYDESAVNLVIASAQLSDTITVAYSANYALFVEMGGRGRPARRFVALAAQNWPSIVEQVCVEARSRAGG